MADVREIEPEAWDRVLGEAGLHDVYARSAYLAASSIVEPGRPLLLTVEDGGGGLPSAALIGGGGVGAVLGVGAGFLIQRRMGKRPADGA